MLSPLPNKSDIISLMQIVDLSVEVNEDTPAYPGDPKIKIETTVLLIRILITTIWFLLAYILRVRT